MFIIELLLLIIFLYILFVVGSSVIITLLMVIGFVGFQDTHNLLFLIPLGIGFLLMCSWVR